MAETPGVMPRAKLASLVPDPDFGGHFEGLGGGSDTKGSLALLQPVSQSIPALTGWAGCSGSVHLLQELWHGGEMIAQQSLKQQICAVGSCF